MHIIQEEIGLPVLSEESLGAFHSLFTIGPLPNGFGTTLGNSLRRVILSSLPGAAVTGIKVKGATHEYQVLKGCKDSVMDIMLNLKQLAVSIEGTETVKLVLKSKKAGTVTAKNIEAPAGVTIHNPELYITTLEHSKENISYLRLIITIQNVVDRSRSV